MDALRVFLTERLAAAAEEILAAVESSVAEYKEACRAKDLEISRLRMQLRLLKSDGCIGAQQHLQAPGLEEEEEEEEDEEEDEEDEEEMGGCSGALPEVKSEEEHRRTFWNPDAAPLDAQHLLPTTGAGDPAASLHLPPASEAKERPFGCGACPKRFGNYSHLAAHVRTHTGERPYRCDTCTKSFVTSSALNRHQTIHTEGKRFSCAFCGRSFKWMDSLGRHVRVFHRRENPPGDGLACPPPPPPPPPPLPPPPPPLPPPR